jgi:hypothetical protein
MIKLSLAMGLEPPFGSFTRKFAAEKLLIANHSSVLDLMTASLLYFMRYLTMLKSDVSVCISPSFSMDLRSIEPSGR